MTVRTGRTTTPRPGTEISPDAPPTLHMPLPLPPPLPSSPKDYHYLLRALGWLVLAVVLFALAMVVD